MDIIVDNKVDLHDHFGYLAVLIFDFSVTME